jgi:predicted DNA binding protein
MRKVTIELVPYPHLMELAEPIFEIIEYVRVLEVLNVNYEKATRAGISEVVMREGHTLDDLIESVPDYEPELLHVMKQEGRKYTILTKVRTPADFRHLVKKFDLDLIAVPPILKSKEKIVVSLFGDEENIKKFIETIKEHLGEVKNISFPKTTLEEHDLLSVLTDRQRQIVTAAMKHGYYSYPRKIGTEKLSEIVGISRATLVEHLRKAEGRLLSSIFAGI